MTVKEQMEKMRITHYLGESDFALGPYFPERGLGHSSRAAVAPGNLLDKSVLRPHCVCSARMGPTTCCQPALQLKSEHGQWFSALATHCNHLGALELTMLVPGSHTRDSESMSLGYTLGFRISSLAM